MARYTKLNSFIGKPRELEAFVQNASPSQLLFSYKEIAETIGRKDSNAVDFLASSAAQQLAMDGKNDLESALQYYRGQGEELSHINDVIKVLALRMDAFDMYDIHINQNSMALVIQGLVKYYLDPVEAVNRLALDYEGNFFGMFRGFPPTRIAVNESGSTDFNRQITPLVAHYKQRNFNKLSLAHSPKDLKELWMHHAPHMQSLIDESPKHAAVYRKARSEGDEKTIRSEMLAKDAYVLMDHFYNNFWDKDGYEALERDFPNLQDEEKLSAFMKMRVHSVMAKIAAELVPEVLDDKQDPKYIANVLGAYLGQLADMALSGFDRVIRLNPESWGMEGNDIHSIIPDEYGGKVMENSMLGEMLFDEYSTNYSPVYVKTKRQLQDARQDERSRQKLVRQREVNARDGQIQALKENLATLQGQLGMLLNENQGLQKRINLTPQAVIDIMQRTGRAAQDEATNIAYAACADHLREKLTLHGEDTGYLKDFPNLESTVATLKASRERFFDSTAEKMINEGSPDPRVTFPAPVGEQASNFVAMKAVDIAAKIALQDIEKLKLKYVPEAEQLKHAGLTQPKGNPPQTVKPEQNNEVPVDDDKGVSVGSSPSAVTPGL